MKAGSMQKIGLTPPSTISKYTLEYMIASGTFGRVYMATYNNRKFAIKQMQQPQKSHLRLQMQNQIKVLTQMTHSNIVKLYEVIKDRSFVYLVMEFCQSDLREVLSDSTVLLSEESALSILLQILNGMNQLVKLHIVHRDLKPANILVSKGVYKIADFGLAKYVQGQTDLLRTRVGTPFYMAPQILRGEKYTSKCDIWSLGIIFYQLLFGKLPWYATNEHDLLFNIQQFPLNLPKNISSKACRLLKGMIAIEQSRRFSWQQIIIQISNSQQQNPQSEDLNKTFHKSMMQKLLNLEFNRLSVASYGRNYQSLKKEQQKSVGTLVMKLFNEQNREVIDYFVQAKLKN